MKVEQQEDSVASSDEDDIKNENKIDDDQQQAAELEKMKQTITENTWNYQFYLNYITSSKKYNNLKHIHYNRQKMSDLFPLIEQL
ncbi:unnamed protein product [Didymodactylos carnosus]|uniref:Uncharacterized protein n=1 Tax=Didymodactylos carnosus TaxID=1234261 RepID=A0A813WNX6_9BILA|nr:unnamed protein product [Didymodactylos carnosus]CAF3642835.1 unnamed protein product [Didymodactylos carnosus]